jgi:alkanesulfonate monooxygenase SsuD/methylene tetrahydromethanopterin reductase-like flavin-dependent oxidoreductase (luciferase family)
MYRAVMTEGAERRTRVGALLPTREAHLRGAGAASVVEFGTAAVDRGFESLWAGDSLTARPRAEPLTLLGGVAVACPEVTIGTAALTGALRQPVLAAHQIATLDQLAGGRLVLGLGAGAPLPATQAEFAAAGADFEGRIRRLDETVTLWRALWDPARDPAQPFDFAGKHLSVSGIEGLPLPARPGGPPLWLAGGGDLALRRAGRLYDGWLPYPPAAEEYGRGLDVAREAATEAGRDPSELTPALYVTVNLGDSSAARAELEHYVLDYYGMPLEVMSTVQAFYAGPVEGCVDWLRAYVDAGARHLVIRFGAADPMQQLVSAAERLLAGLRA